VGDESLHIRPSLSKDLVLQWLHRLRRYRHDEHTRLGTRLVQLGPSLTHRALLIVLSDMHDPSALPALKRLNQSHDCCVLQLRDPAERGLRGAGFFRAREAESGEVAVTHGRREVVDQQPLQTALKRGGIDHLLIDTDQPFAHRLRYFFSARGLLGRGAR
jgi:uncharacterized protein (DUF58 family)